MKTILTILALTLAGATAAEAGYRGHYGYYTSYGYTRADGSSWWGTCYGPCLNNSARVLQVPINMEFNSNPNWGRDEKGVLCRSCFDASK